MLYCDHFLAYEEVLSNQQILYSVV